MTTTGTTTGSDVTYHIKHTFNGSPVGEKAVMFGPEVIASLPGHILQGHWFLELLVRALFVRYGKLADKDRPARQCTFGAMLVFL